MFVNRKSWWHQGCGKSFYIYTRNIFSISQVEYIVLMVQPWGISHCYSTLHCYNLLFYTTAIIWYIIQFLLIQGIFINSLAF